MIEAPLALAALVAAITAVSFWLDRRVRFLSQVGAGMIAILLGAILSNTGLVPAASPVYDAIGGPVTSLAIAWLLLAVDLSAVRRVGARALAAFGLAAAGTAIGALLGSLALRGLLTDDTWRLAGAFTATYIGGSVNFVAVGREVGMSEALFAGATAADNVTTAIWLAATLLIPLWFGRFFAPIPDAARGSAGTDPGHPFFDGVKLSTLDLAMLLALGIALVMAASLVGRLIPAVPSVLWLTTFALVIGHIPAVRKLPGALQLGNLALVLFFVIIGIFSRIADIVAVGFQVFWFTIIVVGVHGLIVFGIGKLLRFDVALLAVASQSNVGGPSSALAVAVAREWPGLVVPGVILGLLGYAIGNYAGFAVAWLVRGFGG